jgi:UDP-glucose 4-epimerase
MRVLITGATGFLGGSVGRALVAGGWTVTGCARRDAPEAGFRVERTTYELDDLARAIADARPQVLLHAAGSASVAASVAEPHADFLSSVVLTHRVLEATRRAGVKPRFVLLSSAAMYGNPERLPVRESTPTNPISPYGFHKAVCELAVREYATCFGIPALIARIFSTFGEAQRRLLAWEVFRKFQDEPEAVLDGTGDETRDFIHAEDLAHQLSAALLKADTPCLTLNFGSGRATSVREIATRIGTLLGSNKPMRFTARSRPGDPRHWQADLSAYEALTGERVRTELDARLRQTLDAWRA